MDTVFVNHPNLTKADWISFSLMDTKIFGLPPLISRPLPNRGYLYIGLLKKRAIPPTEEIDNTTSPSNLRHFLDNPFPLSGRRKFPLWVGYGPFLERPIK